MQTEPTFTEPFNTDLVDIKGEPLFNGDLIKFVYIDPMGTPHPDTIEDEVHRIEFTHGAFIARQVSEPAIFELLIKFVQTREGRYISNYGNAVEFINNTALVVKQ